jgi:hypothetical protein
LRGTADPNFSPLDTIRYQEALQSRYECGVIDEQRWESTPGDGDMSVN